MIIELTVQEIVYLKTAINNQLDRNKEIVTSYSVPDEVVDMYNKMDIALTNILNKLEVQDENS